MRIRKFFLSFSVTHNENINSQVETEEDIYLNLNFVINSSYYS